MDFSSVTNPFDDGGDGGSKGGGQQADGPQEVKEQDEQRHNKDRQSQPRAQPDEAWLFLKVCWPAAQTLVQQLLMSTWGFTQIHGCAGSRLQ